MKPARVIPNSFVATLFREPREHVVMSQYMECAFDYYWTAPTRGEGGVPGSRRGGSFAEKESSRRGFDTSRHGSRTWATTTATIRGTCRRGR